MRDLHNNIKRMIAITPQAVGTTGIAGGKLSAVIDRRGYDSVEFIYSAGTSATVADKITPVVYESDTATTAGFASVADINLVGTEEVMTLTAAQTKSVGYTGNKRYVGIRLYGTGTATAVVAATVDLGHPSRQPVS
jgi:hypothetical protein